MCNYIHSNEFIQIERYLFVKRKHKSLGEQTKHVNKHFEKYPISTRL